MTFLHHAGTLATQRQAMKLLSQAHVAIGQHARPFRQVSICLMPARRANTASSSETASSSPRARSRRFRFCLMPAHRATQRQASKLLPRAHVRMASSLRHPALAIRSTAASRLAFKGRLECYVSNPTRWGPAFGHGLCPRPTHPKHDLFSLSLSPNQSRRSPDSTGFDPPHAGPSCKHSV